MIVFDLKCGNSHVFEGWFGSSADYADQQARGLVSCPICGDVEVEKAPMAPAVPRKGNAVSTVDAPQPLASADPVKIKEMMATLAKMQKAMLSQSDWVGDRFADEARAIHLGETDARTIHGQASKAEVESLVEEGVPVAPLLFPVAPPGEEN